jgi:hypothetical protein
VARTGISATGLWVRRRTIWLDSCVGTSGPYSHGPNVHPTRIPIRRGFLSDTECRIICRTVRAGRHAQCKWAQNVRAPMCSNPSAVAEICPDSHPPGFSSARILIRHGLAVIKSIERVGPCRSEHCVSTGSPVPEKAVRRAGLCQRVLKSGGRKSLRMGGLSCLLAPNLSPPRFLAYLPGVAPLPARTSVPGRSLLSLFGCLL